MRGIKTVLLFLIGYSPLFLIYKLEIFMRCQSKQAPNASAQDVHFEDALFKNVQNRDVILEVTRSSTLGKIHSFGII